MSIDALHVVLALFAAAAVLSVLALALSTTLPKPAK